MVSSTSWPSGWVVILSSSLFCVTCLGCGQNENEGGDQRLEQASRDWSSFEWCLVGSGGSSPIEQLEAIELGLSRRQNWYNTEWPGRCTEYLDALSNSLVALGAEQNPQYGNLLKHSRKASKHLSSLPYNHLFIKNLFQASRAAGLYRAAGLKTIPVNVQLPPEPAQPIPTSKLVPIAKTNLGLNAHFDSSTPLRIVFGTSEGAQNKSVAACAFLNETLEMDRVSCYEIQNTEMTNLALPIATEENNVEDFLLYDGQRILSAKTGKTLAKAYNSGVYAFDDGGVLSRITYSGRPKVGEVILGRLGSNSRVHQLKLPETARWGRQILNYYYWGTSTREDPGDLYIAKIASDGTMGENDKVGDFPALGDLRPHLNYCRSGETIAFLSSVNPRQRSSSSGPSKPVCDQPNLIRVWTALRRSGQWTTSEEYLMPPNIHSSSLQAQAATLTCDDNSLSITWTGNGEIGQYRCTAEGCTKAKSNWYPTSLSPIEAVEFRGKTLVLWRDRRDGPFTLDIDTVRMRLAPIDQLDEANEVVLLADDRFGGPKMTSRIEVMARKDVAIALIHTKEIGWYALRIEENGDFKPMVPTSPYR